MEICFEKKCIPSFIESLHAIKRFQDSADSVVPDINEDIGRIVSVNSSVMLKSKELNNRVLSVSGEFMANVLYIDENETRLSYVNLSKNFSMDFDSVDAENELLTQLKLCVSNCEARALNPRKLTVSYEICAELSAYTQVETELERQIDASQSSVHLKYEQTEVLLPLAVCEKSFAVTEQLIFPSSKAKPGKLIFQSADFFVTDTQLVGSKAIIKGNVSLSVLCTSEDSCFPVSAEFQVPFSQIIDTGKEHLDACCVKIQQSSAYYRLTDTINGETAVDCEIHAVIQLTGSCKYPIHYISDAYSNLAPTACSMKNKEFKELSEPKRLRLSSEEHINIAEDCVDVLCVYPKLQQAEISGGKASCAVQLDVVYRSSNGSLAAVRRSINLEGEYTSGKCRLDSCSMGEINFRPEGSIIECRISVELCLRDESSISILCLEALEISDETAYDYDSFPSLNLVRVEDESLWQLAKSYHSSVETICSMNDCSSPLEGKLLLIPKTL